jgi:hypothetical protein
VNIGDTLEEEKRKDVCLEIRRIDRPTKDVRGLPQMVFELLDADWRAPHSPPSWSLVANTGQALIVLSGRSIAQTYVVAQRPIAGLSQVLGIVARPAGFEPTTPGS